MAFWRVREHLGPLDEGADGRRSDVRRYAEALADSSDYKLDKLLNVAAAGMDTAARRLEFTRVPLNRPPDAETITAGLPEYPRAMDAPVLQDSGNAQSAEWWYLQLAGQCRGFGKKADIRMNTRWACPDAKPKCEPAAMGKRERKEGNRETWLRKALDAGKNACVMAALPSAQQLARGRPLMDWDQSGLTESSAVFLQQAAFWAALVEAKNRPADFNRLLVVGRPPTVPLIPLCGALRDHPTLDPCREKPPEPPQQPSQQP